MTLLRPHNWQVTDANVVCKCKLSIPKVSLVSLIPLTPSPLKTQLHYTNDPCLQQDYIYIGERDKLLKQLKTIGQENTV